MRLVMISLDACFQADTEKLLSLPNLSELMKRGVFCNQVQTVYPTLTYPIHASILSGCYPEKHGIDHNEWYSEDAPHGLRPWHWEAADIRVPTLLTEAAKAGRTTAAILWPTTGKARFIRYNFPEVMAFPWENQVLKVLKYGSPFWIIGNELRFGKKRVSTKQPFLDAYSATIAESLVYREYSDDSPEFANRDVKPTRRRMAKKMPDITLLHLVDVDAMRHDYGVHNETVDQALERVDAHVGTIMKALAYRDCLKDTVFCVLSDHGHIDVKAHVCLNDLFARDGVPAKAHTLGLGAYIIHERSQYRKIYEHLQNNMDTYQLEKVYSREDIRAMHGPRDIHLAVEPKRGVEILESANDKPYRANHGFGIHHPEAQTLLWLSGPGIRSNHRVSACRIVDVAPTLAKAVGLSMPSCDGRILEEVFETR